MYGYDYEKNKEKIINEYEKGYLTIKEIAEKFKCNYAMIFKKFNEWNVPKRERLPRKKRYNAIYNVDYTYFDKIDTEHKAYWFGFFLADGYVNSKEISFCLQEKDKYIITQFLEDLKSNHPIKYNKDKNPYVTIICKPICDSLISKGFNNRKSWGIDFKKVISNVPENLENHFLRGMFDGDGCIKIYKYDYLNKAQIHFGYTGLKEVCEYVGDRLNLKRKLIFEGNCTYTVVTRNSDIINDINNYLYKDATIYISRKYDTFNKIKMMTFNDYNKAVSL